MKRMINIVSHLYYRFAIVSYLGHSQRVGIYGQIDPIPLLSIARSRIVN